MNRDSKPDQRLLAAINQKRLIGLSYNGVVRVAEPHDYGIQNGHPKLLAYQLEPLTDWRSFYIEKMSELRLLEKTFAGGRAAPSGRHQKWDVLFARVGKKDDG
jgi:hypothetical protein